MKPVVFHGLQTGRGQEEVAVSPFLLYHPLQHSLQYLVESLDWTICLWVVDGLPDLLDLQQLTETRH